jgi:hypothetical protein
LATRIPTVDFPDEAGPSIAIVVVDASIKPHTQKISFKIESSQPDSIDLILLYKFSK